MLLSLFEARAQLVLALFSIGWRLKAQALGSRSVQLVVTVLVLPVLV